MNPKIKTANGEVILYPIFCEATGKQIAWSAAVDCHTPAYISFEVVDENGQIKQSLEKINTF